MRGLWRMAARSPTVIYSADLRHSYKQINYSLSDSHQIV